MFSSSLSRSSANSCSESCRDDTPCCRSAPALITSVSLCRTLSPQLSRACRCSALSCVCSRGSWSCMALLRDMLMGRGEPLMGLPRKGLPLLLPMARPRGEVGGEMAEGQSPQSPDLSRATHSNSRLLSPLGLWLSLRELGGLYPWLSLLSLSLLLRRLLLSLLPSLACVLRLPPVRLMRLPPTPTSTSSSSSLYPPPFCCSLSASRSSPKLLLSRHSSCWYSEASAACCCAEAPPRLESSSVCRDRSLQIM
mmetsp:Transcript_24701/g.54871  ORF Transcript_24701/g.54871 Transcript_24701/m.54871 type:complete len:252 (-) Transcript_24701:123-878(-)